MAQQMLPSTRLWLRARRLSFSRSALMTMRLSSTLTVIDIVDTLGRYCVDMSRYLTRERDMSEVTMTTPSTRPGERCQGGPVLPLLRRLQGVTWSL